MSYGDRWWGDTVGQVVIVTAATVVIGLILLALALLDGGGRCYRGKRRTAGPGPGYAAGGAGRGCPPGGVAVMADFTRVRTSGPVGRDFNTPAPGVRPRDIEAGERFWVEAGTLELTTGHVPVYEQPHGPVVFGIPVGALEHDPEPEPEGG